MPEQDIEALLADQYGDEDITVGQIEKDSAIPSGSYEAVVRSEPTIRVDSNGLKRLSIPFTLTQEGDQKGRVQTISAQFVKGGYGMSTVQQVMRLVRAAKVDGKTGRFKDGNDVEITLQGLEVLLKVNTTTKKQDDGSERTFANVQRVSLRV